jgi:uncharacterized protein YegP (UPF0339 family)
MEFVITCKTNGLYYFALKADNGKAILSSSGYTSKWGVRDGIKSVKMCSKDDSSFDRMMSTSNKYYFYLKEPNGHVRGESKLYTSPIRMEETIEAVKKSAPKALISDLTIKRAKSGSPTYK